MGGRRTGVAARSHARRSRGVLVLALATSVGIAMGPAVTGGAQAGASRVRFGSSHNHKPPPKKPKGHGKTSSSGAHPCLVGNWVVKSMTLSTVGLSFTGGAGTTVDISSNGNALGNFTPGTPLTGSEGSAKFNGTITDHYGFSPTTTARSGSFSSVTTVTDNGTITVAGTTRPVSPSPETGSYTCSGSDLTLTFTSNGNTLTYQLAPAG